MISGPLQISSRPVFKDSGKLTKCFSCWKHQGLGPLLSDHLGSGVPSLLLVTHLTASDEGRRENPVTALSHIEGVAGPLGQDLNPSLRDLRSCHCASLTRENSLC